MKVDAKLVRWRDGFPCPVNAKDAYQEFERLRAETDGELRPELVVDAAKDGENVLHPAFEWDNKKAAHEYRCEQARGMLRSLVVVRKEYPKEPTRVYGVQRVEVADDKPRKVYKSLEDVLQDDAGRAELFQRTLNQLVCYRRKYAALKELSLVWRAVDEVLENVAV